MPCFASPARTTRRRPTYLIVAVPVRAFSARSRSRPRSPVEKGVAAIAELPYLSASKIVSAVEHERDSWADNGESGFGSRPIWRIGQVWDASYGFAGRPRRAFSQAFPISMRSSEFTAMTERGAHPRRSRTGGRRVPPAMRALFEARCHKVALASRIQWSRSWRQRFLQTRANSAPCSLTSQGPRAGFTSPVSYTSIWIDGSDAGRPSNRGNRVAREVEARA